MKYNQTEIIKKINTYLKLKSRHITLDLGYCHGLTLLWLYKMSEKKEKWYYDSVKKIVDVPEEKLSEIEIDIEKFIAHVEWLQQPEKYIPSIRQMDMDKTVEIPKEIPVSSIFEPKQLDAVLELVIQSEKMVCMTGPDHSIGVFRRGEKFHIYNPNYDSGVAKVVDTIVALRLELIKCLFTDFNHPGGKLPVTINVLGEDDSTRERSGIYKWIIEITGAMTFCDSGIGPLYLACENNNEELAKMLLEKGAVPNKPTHTNKYPLVLASYSGYASVVSLLLKYKANPNLEGREGLPLFLASKHGHENVIKLLLEHGAQVNKSDADGDTAIFAAVDTGDKKLIKLLLEQKADPLHARKDGYTPMDIAVRKKDWDTVALMLMFVDTPHVRNHKAIKQNKKYLLAASKKITEEKLIVPAECRKIETLVEKISTKKSGLPTTLKNPEYCRRGNLPGSLSLGDDRNSFFAHAEKRDEDVQASLEPKPSM